MDSNSYIPGEIFNRMSMGSSSEDTHACKISMLWNWYTIDSCFIARTWHVRTRGQFAGTCIGIFLIVMGAQWLHRIGREYDLAINKRRVIQKRHQLENENLTPASSATINNTEFTDKVLKENYITTTMMPILETLSHSWFWNFRKRDSTQVYPNLLDHVLRGVLFTIQWLLSYIIMLLFMYYNGYIIISCFLGAFFGRLIFNYEPLCQCDGPHDDNLYDKQADDKKCCM
ncbi:hypothetical protein B5S31_g4602 [[Candida] boidinii]|nr:hypothetical protein B5S29_g2204 [[Candida] boidinii]OWB74779.1 hypothetical protein B5S31_g4602 [[Candida] boidinii]